MKTKSYADELRMGLATLITAMGAGMLILTLSMGAMAAEDYTPPSDIGAPEDTGDAGTRNTPEDPGHRASGRRGQL